MARAGYVGNLPLQRYLERATTLARPIVEAVITTNEDIKDTKQEYLDADSTTGWTELEEGGARLERSATDQIAHSPTLSNPQTTNLNGPALGTPVDVLVIEWAGESDPENIELHTLVADLDPASGGSKEVEEWWAQLFRVHSIEAADPLDESSEKIWHFQQLGGIQKVTAGASAGDVTFNFGAFGNSSLTVGAAPDLLEGVNAGDEGVVTVPTTCVWIWGVKAGGIAANIGWRGDGTKSTASSGGNTFSKFEFKDTTTIGTVGPTKEYVAASNGLPSFSLKGASYSAATITFSTNPVDLGAVPTNTVEFVAEGMEPGGSSLTFEVHDGSSWQEYADGDKAATDNTADGGFDLSGVALAQTYDMRVTLTPTTTADMSPTVRRLGAREITSSDLDGLVKLGAAEFQVDPVTLRPEIAELQMELIRDGIRDYRDTGTELISDNYISALTFRIWIGHPDLERRYWLHHSDWVIDRQDSAGASIMLTLVSPLSFLRQTIPVVDTINNKQEPLEYDEDSATLTSTISDLLTGQISLGGRYIGPMPSDTDAVGKKITKERKAKDEIDRLAYLAGGAVIESQGRLKFVDMFPNRAAGVEDVFPQEEVSTVRVDPGYEHRRPQFGVSYGWDPEQDDGRGAYEGLSLATNNNAIENLGQARIQAAEELDDETAMWLPSSANSGDTFADTISTRAIDNLGAGRILWQFESASYPRPHLEPGDLVAVQTDRFAARDPHAGRALRGTLWGIGAIVGVHDVLGTRFSVWIQDYADILPGSATISKIKYARPAIVSATPQFTVAGLLDMDIQGNSDTGAVKIAYDPSAFPGKSTVQAQSFNATDSDNHVVVTDVTAGVQVGVGDNWFVSILAYESSTGGAESVELFKLSADRPPYFLPHPQWLRSQSSTGSSIQGRLECVLEDPDSVATDVLFIDSSTSTDGTFNHGDPTDGNWTSVGTTGTLAHFAALNANHNTQITGAVAYPKTDGTTGSAHMFGSFSFDLDIDPEFTITPVISTTGGASLTARGDEDFYSGKFAARTTSAFTAGSTADEAVVRAASAIGAGGDRNITPSEVGTLVTASANDTVYYGAFGYSSTGGVGTESKLVTAEKTFGVDTQGIVTGAVHADRIRAGMRGWFTNCVFSAGSFQQVNWGAGTLKYRDGTSYSIDAGNTGAMAASTDYYIYFDPAVSTTVLQVSTTYDDAISTEDTTYMCLARRATNSLSEAFFVVVPGHIKVEADQIADKSISASQIVANSITTNEIQSLTIVAGDIAGGTITAAKLNVAELSAIAVDAGTLTAGLIQNSAGTNFVDMDATGAQNFIKAGSQFSVTAAGAATFGGTVTSSSFTAATANFNAVTTLGLTCSGIIIGSGNLEHRGSAAQVGFFNVGPVSKQAGFTQAYSSADRTISSYTADNEGSAYTGAADGEAKLADLNALRVAYENLRAHAEDVGQGLNAVIDTLQAYGLV